MLEGKYGEGRKDNTIKERNKRNEIKSGIETLKIEKEKGEIVRGDDIKGTYAFFIFKTTKPYRL